MQVKEVRKADVGGKEFVMALTCNAAQTQPMYLAASTQTIFDKWIKAIRSIKEAIELAKQKEKELFKFEMSQVAINKERAQQAFGVQNRPIQFTQEKHQENFDLSNLFMNEQNVKKEIKQKMEREIKKKMGINLAKKLS